MKKLYNKICCKITNYFVYDSFTKINASKKHKVGNIITGIFKIIDGLILVLSFGNFNGDLTMNWSIYRRKTKTLYDNNL